MQCLSLIFLIAGFNIRLLFRATLPSLKAPRRGFDATTAAAYRASYIERYVDGRDDGQHRLPPPY